MKYLILLIFFSINLFSQEKTETEKPSIDQSKIAVSVPGPGAGLGDASWGKPFESIREQIMSIRNNPDVKEKIEILNEVKDKSLLVKRNNITYLYRFYKKPKILAKFNKSKENDHSGTSMLFSVGIYFSPVESLKLKKQIEDKYGKVMKEPQAQIPKDKFSKPEDEDDSLDGNDDSKKIAGFYSWTFKRTGETNVAEGESKAQAPSKGEFILQWVEPYNKKAFSKRMDYFSIDKSDLINIDYKDYFSARETDILLDLINEGIYQEEDKKNKEEKEVLPVKSEVSPAKN